MKIKIIIGCLIFFSLVGLSLATELPKDKYWLFEIKEGQSPDSLFGENLWIVARINRMSPLCMEPGKVLKIPYDFEWAKTWSPLPETHEAYQDSAKLVYIDLSDQWFGAYEKGLLVFSGPICSGKKGKDAKGRQKYPTPIGTFKVEIKEPMHWSKKFKIWMPYTIFFWRGCAIHAGILVGSPVSGGCVRLFPEDAERLYNWVQLNTPVIIRQ